jgi:hypothetical protein
MRLASPQKIRSNAFFGSSSLSSHMPNEFKNAVHPVLLLHANLDRTHALLLRRQPPKIAPRKPTLPIPRRLRSLLLLLLPDLTLILLLHLQRRQLHAILRPWGDRRRVPIPIPSGLLWLLLTMIHRLLLSIKSSLLLLCHHLLLIRRHLRLRLLVLPSSNRLFHHHTTSVAAFHGGFLALAGADGAYEAQGLVFLLFLLAGSGDCVEEGRARGAGDVHLFAGGEVGGLRVGEEAAGRIEVEAGAAGERAAGWCWLGLLGGLIEVCAGAAGERTTWWLVVEVRAGAARVWSTWR